jgi:mono/diheme cytochrome c family protein
MLVLLAVGCGGEETVAPVPETVAGEVPTSEEPGTTTEENGGAAEGDAEAGKTIYAANGCGGCHVLEAAGSQGTVGPNLDESKPDYEKAVTQIENGGNGMPAFKDSLTEKQIADVATFVVESTQG